MESMSALLECSLTYYAAADAAILSALEPLAGPHPAWSSLLDQERCHLVVASQYGRVVGFVVVAAPEGTIKIVDLVVSPHAERRDAVMAALVDGGLDAADSAWGDVDISAVSEAVPHLLRSGWRPLVIAGRGGERLILSGANAS